MKIKFTLFTFLLAFAAFVFSSSSGGRATAANAGNTGAPGDGASTCATCHSSGSFNPTVTVEVTAVGSTTPITAYMPGTTYDVTMTIAATAGTPSGYGFQIVSLENAGNTPINNWSNPSSNTQLATIGNGRQYAEQNGTSTSNTFTMQWTAPAASTGAVTMYYGGNAVNGDGGTGSDKATMGTLVLSEMASAVTADAATNVVGSDVADAGNGSDVQVSFDKAADEGTIGEYRVIVVKDAQAGSFDLAAAQGLAAGRYTVISPTGAANYTQTLAANALDSDGAAIANATTYKVFVQSVADGTNATLDELSSASASFMVADLSSTNGLAQIEATIYNTSTNLVVEVPNVFDYKTIAVEVFSLNGQQILTENVTNAQTIISTENWSKGIYLVMVRTDRGVTVQKIMKG